jgi:hypothetical protein
MSGTKSCGWVRSAEREIKGAFMASANYLPDREAELVTWVNTFKALIVASPTTYGLVAAQATAYDTLATNFINAYNLANADATRSPSNIIAKNAAKDLLIASTRQLAGIIQKFPGTTDEMRSDLGLTVKTVPTPIPVPTQPPVLEIHNRIGTQITIRLHDGSGNRAKPRGVQGARLYSFVGATPPAEIEDWKFEGQVTRTDVPVDFGPDIAPGTLVWFTAGWYNPRGEMGPGCTPVSAFIAGGTMPLAA